MLFHNHHCIVKGDNTQTKPLAFWKWIIDWINSKLLCISYIICICVEKVSVHSHINLEAGHLCWLTPHIRHINIPSCREVGSSAGSRDPNEAFSSTSQDPTSPCYSYCPCLKDQKLTEMRLSNDETVCESSMLQ